MKKRCFLFAFLSLFGFAFLATPHAWGKGEKVRQLEERVKALEKALKSKGNSEAPLRNAEELAESDKEGEKKVGDKKEAEAKKSSSDQKGGEKSSSDDEIKFRTYFKDTLHFKSDDGNFHIKFGGRVLYDLFWGKEQRGLRAVSNALNTGTPNGFTDGTEFRAVRLYNSGVLYKHIGYKLQIDFANVGTGNFTFKDVWISLMGPFGIDKDLFSIKVGHFKEPFGLSEMTNPNFRSFMENNMVTEAFAPSRNAGIAVYGSPSPNMTYTLGIFRTTENFGGSDQTEGSYNFTTRVTFAPLHDPKKGRVFHLGLGYSFRHFGSGQTARFRSRPEAHLAPRLIDTGTFTADHAHLVALEAALILGRISLSGELYTANVITPVTTANDPAYWGAYVQVGFFLTDDHRGYKKGKFARVRPKKNFMQDDGLGAFEVTLRVSHLDLTDGQTGNGAGREQSNVTLGFNWFLNPNVRITANYTYVDLKHLSSSGLGGSNTGNIFQIRFQIAF